MTSTLRRWCPRPADAGWGLFAFLALQLAFFRGYRIDDVYIHLTYARGLAETGGLHYNGVVVNAMSSPAWALLLAVGLVAGLPPLLLAKGLGFACTALALALAAGLAARRGAGPAACRAAGVAAAAAPWFAKFAATGMEVGLAAAWALAVVHRWLDEAEDEARAQGLWGLLGGVGLAVRLELGLLLAALWLVDLARTRRPAWRPVALGILGAAPWFAVAAATFGSPFPTTVAAKTAGAKAPWGKALVRVGGIFGLELGPWALAAAWLAWRRPAGRTALAETAGPALLTALAGFLSRGSFLGRYLAPFGPLAWAGVAAATPEEGRAPRLVAAGGLAWGLAAGALLNVPWVENYNQLLDVSEVASGELMARDPVPGPVVAFDVGAAAFFSHRPVIDLVGLVTPALIGASPEAREAFVAARRPRYLLRTVPGWHVAPDAGALAAAGAGATRVMDNPHGGYQLRAPQPFRFECWRLEWPEAALPGAPPEGPTGTSR